MLRHEFVEYIPDNLNDNTIYVSIKFGTVAHKCCCGCGNEVFTPLSPTDWKLIFNGKSISLEPSIGNWSFECKSHYWIRHNDVIWAVQWSQEEIDAARIYDRSAKEKYFEDASSNVMTEKPKSDKQKQSSWMKLKQWWLQYWK
ncbi:MULTISPECIES: DUF6527 family protein [Nostoc]|uniref:Uncharacterized protein n=2 Tax=Nostoc TaxID=1177 RepID=A0ABR8I9A9_9NOSO|nr:MULTISPECIES: DUF6527 family protein [Nostoc]MBD2560677.1 hypothetical protein [Nostoc linckia FACHB-391]MBD2648226.1 hypothetical protein [Nostoc foliaceum FACHB-393]OYD91583.1 hypothetical protein CDG76_27250 [Nostoc sp. 'Peltigera membranacea cyanobiont' 210A]